MSSQQVAQAHLLIRDAKRTATAARREERKEATKVAAAEYKVFAKKRKVEREAKWEEWHSKKDGVDERIRQQADALDEVRQELRNLQRPLQLKVELFEADLKKLKDERQVMCCHPNLARVDARWGSQRFVLEQTCDHCGYYTGERDFW
ncbi:MAG: hypothetical protein COB04_16255 [Gammaproteobacteria bacterium]|nr:MAG: hypothetical protein COB04_16255 [Gammaproteobacteria bacterium]